MNKNLIYTLSFCFIWIALMMLISCSPQKRWSDKGFRKGWIDTSKIKLIDTVHFYGSSKDTSFLYSKDTIILKDDNFTTFFYNDTTTHHHYLKTVVNNHDTVIVREVQRTTVKVSEYSFTDHIKALWPLWLGLLALIILMFIWRILK